MEDTRPFYQFLYKFVDLTSDEYQHYIVPYIQIRKFKKKQVISAQGEVENYFNFILSGLVRKFYKMGEEEHTLQLASEGHIIHDQDSFHLRTPSDATIVALEPATLISITFEDLERIYSTNSKMERLGRLVITFAMLQRDKRQLLMMKQSPRERFMHLVNNYSELMQRVPQKYLASYLNIQPETFSRFKHLVRVRR